MHKNINQVFDNKVKLDLSSSKITLKNSGRVTDRKTDMIGRWSYQFPAYKDNRHLVVVLAYQPCKQDIQEKVWIKTITVTAQQQSILDLDKRYI